MKFISFLTCLNPPIFYVYILSASDLHKVSLSWLDNNYTLYTYVFYVL
jgi:hypothetical protein